MCRETLNGAAVEFCGEIAFCKTCSFNVLTEQLNALIALREEHGYSSMFTWAKGLHLYTPPPYVPRNVAAWIAHVPAAVQWQQRHQNAPPGGLESWERTSLKREDV
jgi:hypothetical protein